jgi:hypothetical protein
MEKVYDHTPFNRKNIFHLQQIDYNDGQYCNMDSAGNPTPQHYDEYAQQNSSPLAQQQDYINNNVQ